jgi:hypothetical protein
MANPRKTFIAMCDGCGTLSFVPRAVAKPLIDAIQSGQQDTTEIALGGCKQVVKEAATPAGKCTGTIRLVGVVMLLPRDIPYE